MSEEAKHMSNDFQQRVLALMWVDDGFCAKASTLLDKNFFSADLEWVFDENRSYYGKFGKRPSVDQLRYAVSLQDRNQQVEKAEQIEKLHVLSDAVANQKEWIKRELTGEVRKHMFVNFIQKGAGLYNAGQHGSAYDLTQKKIEELNLFDFCDERTVDFSSCRQVINNMASSQKEAVPTGINALDDALLGGMTPQSWTTWIGASGVGKSMLSANLAYFAAEKGKRTFITIHEDEEEPTQVRFLSRFSQIPYNRLVQGYAMLTEEERVRFDRAEKMLHQYVQLKFMYGEESTIEDVTRVTRLKKKDWNFQLFICDYGQCLKSRSFKFKDQVHAIQEYIYWELKNIAAELKIAGCGGAQSNREGHKINRAGKDFMRETDVGDSWGIVKKSSNIITMNRSHKDMLNNQIVFYLGKARHGKYPKAVGCKTDFSIAATHLAQENRLQSPEQWEISLEGGTLGLESRDK